MCRFGSETSLLPRSPHSEVTRFQAGISSRWARRGEEPLQPHCLQAPETAPWGPGLELQLPLPGQPPRVSAILTGRPLAVSGGWMGLVVSQASSGRVGSATHPFNHFFSQKLASEAHMSFTPR